MKSTWKTPEFWATLIGNVIGLVVLTGGLTPAEGTEMTSALQAVAGGVLSVLTICGFMKAQSVRKAAAASLLVAKIHKHGGDPLDVVKATSLDSDVKKLLTAL